MIDHIVRHVSSTTRHSFHSELRKEDTAGKAPSMLVILK